MRWSAILLVLPLVAGADNGQRERLAAERARLQQGFAAEEQACHQRFAVTGCVDGVRERRRAALKPLRERELQLSDADRLQRGQERQAARDSRTQPVREPRRAASAEVPAVPLRPSPMTGGAVRRTEDPAARSAEAAERVRAAARRAQAAQETAAEVARRQEQRRTRGKQSAPLPVPAPPAATASGVGP